MNIEWLKNKLGEKFYPITHVGSVLCGDSNETLETKLLAIDENVDSMQTHITTNLLKPTLQTTTLNGVTCTNNGDGTYTVDGTATSDVSFLVAVLTLTGTYKILGAPKSESVGKFYVGGVEVYYAPYSGLISKYDNTIIQYDIAVASGVTVNKELVKPMITTDLNATYDDFVPFTGTTGKLNGDVAELEKSNEGKMGKENPTGTGAFSMNRKADTTVGENSTTEGSNCEASAICSHAEGESTTASGSRSHAEGNVTTASGYASHSEGSSTNKASSYIASDSTDDEIKTRWKSSANGFSLAKGDASHVEGTNCVALGNSAHAEGKSCIALGDNSHAGGRYSEASGDCSTAVGIEVKASRQSQTVFGKYNNNKSYTLLEVGNGYYDEARSNALELDLDGNLEIAGNFYFTDENGNKVSLRSILTRLSALEG